MNINQARAIIGTVTAETVAARFGCTIERKMADGYDQRADNALAQL